MSRDPLLLDLPATREDKVRKRSRGFFVAIRVGPGANVRSVRNIHDAAVRHLKAKVDRAEMRWQDGEQFESTGMDPDSHKVITYIWWERKGVPTAEA